MKDCSQNLELHSLEMIENKTKKADHLISLFCFIREKPELILDHNFFRKYLLSGSDLYKINSAREVRSIQFQLLLNIFKNIVRDNLALNV